MNTNFRLPPVVSKGQKIYIPLRMFCIYNGQISGSHYWRAPAVYPYVCWWSNDDDDLEVVRKEEYPYSWFWGSIRKWKLSAIFFLLCYHLLPWSKICTNETKKVAGGWEADCRWSYHIKRQICQLKTATIGNGSYVPSVAIILLIRWLNVMI